MILHISKPDAEDYNELTEICLKSIKHWGYPNFLIEIWKEELTITPRYIRNHDLLKIENEHGEILGFGSMKKDHLKDFYEIDHFWVLPEYIEGNAGKLLLENLEKKVAPQKMIKVVSDPNTLLFYQNSGYLKVGETKSKPDGRSLPILKKIIDNQI